MWDFFDLKRNRYNLRGSYLSRLPDTNTSPYADAQSEIFQGSRGFVKLGNFHKNFIKKSRNKEPEGKILEFFLLDTLKTAFCMANLT